MLPTIPQAALNVRPIGPQPHRRFLNPGELEVLVALVRRQITRVKRNVRMVEIGCNDGRTAAAILREEPNVERYVGLDVPPGYQFEKIVQRREVPDRPGQYALGDPRFVLMLNKFGTLALDAAQIGPADVVFIDGDHSRRAVLHDTALASELLRRPGMIIWHDYHDQGTVDVKPVLDGFYANGSKIMHVANTWIAVEEIE